MCVWIIKKRLFPIITAHLLSLQTSQSIEIISAPWNLLSVPSKNCEINFILWSVIRRDKVLILAVLNGLLLPNSTAGILEHQISG